MVAGLGPREIVDAYLSDLESRSTEHHVANVRSYLTRALAACPDLSVLQVLRWRKSLRDAGRSNRTANTAIGAISSCLRWAHGTGLVPEAPSFALRRLPQRQGDLVHRRRAMTDAEIYRFLAAAGRLDAAPLVPQAPLWKTLLETGLRFSEASALRAASIDGRDLVVHASSAKTRTGRRVPISPALRADLRALSSREFLFLSPRGKPWHPNNRGSALHLFHRTCRVARVPRRDPEGRILDIHALRVTACSRMLRRGVPVEIVQRVLGHSDPQMTLRVYADLTLVDMRLSMRKAWRKRPG